MSELARNIASRLRQYIGDRRRAERFRVSLPVEISILQEHNSSIRRLHSTKSQTVDVSTTGLGLMVPVIRLGDQYLAGENRKLVLKLQTPKGLLDLHVTPVRYERLEEPEQGYIIGVSITAMTDEDRELYKEYLSSLPRHRSPS